MSTLYLIRHGQASYGAADYDVLSELGVLQSRELGAWMARTGHALDAIYSGPLRRQRDTAIHLREAAQGAGAVVPEVQVEEGLREYPAHDIVRHFGARFAAGQPGFEDFLALNDGRGVDVRQFDARQAQRLFEALMLQWAQGLLSADDLESYASFFARVTGVLRRLQLAHGQGQRVAVVTSGGPVAVCVGFALGVDVHRTMRLSWVLNNTSVTELRCRGDELSLSRFNQMAHLPVERHTLI